MKYEVTEKEAERRKVNKTHISQVFEEIFSFFMESLYGLHLLDDFKQIPHQKSAS